MSSDGPQYPVYPEHEPERADEGQSEEPGSQPPPPGGPQPPPPPAQSWQPSATTPAHGQPAAPGSAPTNQKAIWALVLGIVGLLCCGIFTAIPALIVGIMANKEIGASGGYQAGRGMAIAGIVLGTVGTILSLLLIAFWGFVVTAPEFQEGFREGFEGAR